MFIFFFNDTATTEIYTLSLHDALPIYRRLIHPQREPLVEGVAELDGAEQRPVRAHDRHGAALPYRSEEHTSELQSRQYLVCRLLLEKKKRNVIGIITRV